MRRRLPAMVAVAVGTALTLTVAPSARAQPAGHPAAAERTAAAPRAAAPIEFHRWRSFARGRHEGTAGGATLRFARAAGTQDYTDPFGGGTKTWEYARWTSPVHSIGFGATQLVASWTAAAPAGTWLQVEMRAHTSTGHNTKWYVMGRWAEGDGDIHRTSVNGQRDADGTVFTDTFVPTAGTSISSYQLRVTLYRLPGSAARTSARSLGALASAVPERTEFPVSPPGGAWGIELKVPRYSQNIHVGEYPQWDGGGEAWCSPTSTSMVVASYGRGPSPADYAWVDPSYADPWVDYAARNTYDYAYEGAGNWPFNTAYAGRFGLDGFVTQLRSLTELERFIRAGIPIVTSQSFEAEELPGAGYSTNGHLMVIIGFTRTGDVIANDPASPSNDAVRRVYPRAAFEKVWQRSTGGVVYVIHPKSRPLPPHLPGRTPNW
ncbi:MAG TPA: C39 family peptidase [Streptosporangiaceae bacterium]|nr:C39 family peptidase [Streptosporangiaceae bacterium]